MQSFKYRSVRYWSKEIDGTLTEGQKVIFLIRGDDASMDHGGRACGILSIHGPEVSLGSLWVVLDMVSRLPRMRPGSGHNRPVLSSLEL